MILKVCGITQENQFCWLSQRGVEMIGLNFYPPSKRYIEKPWPGYNTATEMQKVGVFVNPELQYLLDRIEEFNLDMVQLHGDESAEFCEDVANYTDVIKAFGVDEKFSFGSVKPYIDCTSYFLFDTKSNLYGGSGKKFDWLKLNEYSFDKPFLLSGGILLDDIMDIQNLNILSLIGIDVNSGFEVSPGIKDLDKIGELMNKIEEYESR